MSEITPGCSPTPEPSQRKLSQNCGADLAPVSVSPSRSLWLAQLALLCLMLLSATIAVLPFMLTAFYWPVAWVVFLAALVYSGGECWRAKNEAAKTLSVQQNIWRLRDAGEEKTVTPCDEILLWSWVIILPLRTENRQKIYLIAMRDSVDADAWRRLSLWLRICFKSQPV